MSVGSVTPRNTPTRRPRVGAIHIHSDYSHDGKDSLEAIRASAIARKMDFLGMTEHAEDFVEELYEEYIDHCARLSDDKVVIIPGLEFRFAGYPGLHLLALGLPTFISPESPEEFIHTATGAAALTVLAHPVLCRYRVPEIVLRSIDAIEVWNGNYNTRYLPDTRSIDLLDTCQRMGRRPVATVGLDQHDASNDRELRIAVGADAQYPLEEIRSGRFLNIGRTMQFDATAHMNERRLRRLRMLRFAIDKISKLQDRLFAPRR
jgi:hypothetical protein